MRTTRYACEACATVRTLLGAVVDKPPVCDCGRRMVELGPDAKPLPLVTFVERHERAVSLTPHEKETSSALLAAALGGEEA